MTRPVRPWILLGLLGLTGCAGTCCPRAPAPCSPPCPNPVAAAAVAPPRPTEMHAALDRAIEAAQAAQKGLTVEAGYEEEAENGVRTAFIEVMILDAAGKAFEVKVDAATGGVLKVGPADEADEAEELGAIVRRLPTGHLGLPELVRRAAATGGTPLSAGFRARAGASAECVVVLRSGEKSRRVAVDPVSGAVQDAPRAEPDEDDEAEEPPGRPGN